MKSDVWQRTLAKPVALTGIGLHTGLETTLTFCPAPADTGYILVRKDIPGEPRISPRPELVSQTTRGTTIQENGVKIHTIEHALAALAGLEVDNCLVELTASEPPIMDGSAQPYVQAILKTGIVEIPGSKRQVFRLPKPVILQNGSKEIVGWPYPGLRITYNLYYDHPWLQPQRVDVELSPEVFEKQVAHCRTFCLEQEIDWLKSNGLAKGGSLENALVIGEQGPLNPPLRTEQELGMHKILDFIGDLALFGSAVQGHFVAHYTGHEMNARLVQQLKKIKERNGIMERGKEKMIIDAKEIETLLPHRYPMLLVDRVIDLEIGKRVVGIKNVTMNEQFFQGHFPGHPIMPGVLIIEAMAQCGGVLLMKSFPDARDKVVYFMGIDNVKFRKPVVPGDQLRLEIEVDKLRSKIAKMHGKAFVGEDLVCEADLMSVIMDR
ncbi:bifunctional UDP-3-O-[3-hydroxymyristoyl] N-acetylglucosamine deacetylase/3-hydroxyacyl-ACP dehydratase [bacterium]|nr:bifunctional UDP-3-O-[3-hydroxymyristoyl] N-acetylglucosamine deacetylase/3-hydroxyacyl-ACP dehydratase [bacterium]